MKVLFTTIFLINIAYANESMLDASISATPTLGVNDSTHELYPGSTWQLEVLPVGQASCTAYNSQYTKYRDFSLTVTSYQAVGAGCDSASHPDDINNLIDWVDDGYEQLESFGTESITCPIFGACEMNRVVNTQNLYFDDSLSPTLGESGTNPGNIKVFTHKVNTLTSDNSKGTGGTAGTVDISNPTAVWKNCVEITDAVVGDVTESTSKMPYATVHRYYWRPVNFGSNGSSGVDAPNNGKTEVYQGVDPNLINSIIHKLYIE